MNYPAVNTDNKGTIAADQDDTVTEAAERNSVVRLIIQHPKTGAVLLRRFDTDEGDTYEYLSHWSFKGLAGFRIFKDETVLDAVARKAHRQLGIEIHDLNIIMQVNSPHFSSPVLQRVYLHTRNWSGVLKNHCNPECLIGADNAHQGLHDWCFPQFLSTYLSHPEVVKAARMANELVGLSQVTKPS